MLQAESTYDNQLDFLNLLLQIHYFLSFLGFFSWRVNDPRKLKTSCFGKYQTEILRAHCSISVRLAEAALNRKHLHSGKLYDLLFTLILAKCYEHFFLQLQVALRKGESRPRTRATLLASVLLRSSSLKWNVFCPLCQGVLIAVSWLSTTSSQIQYKKTKLVFNSDSLPKSISQFSIRV